MGRRVYVVIGSSGEYEDARQWTVRAFARRRDAEAYAVAAKAAADKRRARLNAIDFEMWGEREMARKAPTRLDPGLAGSHDVDIGYHVEAVPFSEGVRRG